MSDCEATMPFGKYKGRKLDEVPAAYLDWLRDQEWLGEWPAVSKYIEDNAKWIDHDLESEDEP